MRMRMSQSHNCRHVMFFRILLSSSSILLLLPPPNMMMMMMIAMISIMKLPTTTESFLIRNLSSKQLHTYKDCNDNGVGVVGSIVGDYFSSKNPLVASPDRGSVRLFAKSSIIQTNSETTTTTTTKTTNSSNGMDFVNTVNAPKRIFDTSLSSSFFLYNRTRTMSSTSSSTSLSENSNTNGENLWAKTLCPPPPPTKTKSTFLSIPSPFPFFNSLGQNYYKTKNNQQQQQENTSPKSFDITIVWTSEDCPRQVAKHILNQAGVVPSIHDDEDDHNHGVIRNDCCATTTTTTTATTSTSTSSTTNGDNDTCSTSSTTMLLLDTLADSLETFREFCQDYLQTDITSSTSTTTSSSSTTTVDDDLYSSSSLPPLFQQQQQKQKQTYKARLLATRGPTGTKCPQWHIDHVPVRWIQCMAGPGCHLVTNEAAVNWNAITNGLDNDDDDNDNYAELFTTTTTSSVQDRNRRLVDHVNFADCIYITKEEEAVVMIGNQWNKWSKEQQQQQQHQNDKNSFSSIKTTHTIRPVIHKSPSDIPSWQGRVLLTQDILLPIDDDDDDENNDDN